MASKAGKLNLLSITCLFLPFITPCFSQTDTISKGQTVDQLVSQNGFFVLDFFAFEFSDFHFHRYLRIRYTEMSSANLWIANRDNPITVPAALTIDDQGSLKILQDGGQAIVLYSVGAPRNTSATLDNSGNFMLHEMNPDGSKSRVLWQSFDHPTDTLLPGMKLGISLKTGLNWSLTSWRSKISPAKGSFMLGMDPDSADQLVIWWRGVVHWKSGSWLKGNFSFLKGSSYKFTYHSNDNEKYFNYTVTKAITLFPLLQLDEDGDLISQELYRVAQSFGFTNHGCVERKRMKFILETGFMSRKGFIFSESDNLSLADCKAKCLHNCSCFAYATTNEVNTGCEIWTANAVFRKSYSSKARTLHILESKETYWWLWLIVALSGVIILVPLASMIYIICNKFQEEGNGVLNQRSILKELGGVLSAASKSKAKDHKKEGNELQIFGLEIIAAATNYFSPTNKLGQGGYGPVYKGKLPDGPEIAIKRLSRNSGQGLTEFKNEATLIAKLQHTNLVRLLGFCIQGEEKILVYEYMPNKSLDFFLFDSASKSSLNWRKRFIIIEGIAQGLLYLHNYSRLKVIHRDLKASNILLDGEMNPKISDFGMARIFGPHESVANTNRVVGTYGYMAPEYAFHGIVSTKTDVFSFGVLLLEIVSGKKSNYLYHPDHPLNLIGYAWQLWNEGRALEIMDPTMDESCPHNEVLRCIHVGLLCVQDISTDRPTMLDVIAMLSHAFIPLPAPKQPAFFINAEKKEPNGSAKKPETYSVNHLSISVTEAR